MVVRRDRRWSASGTPAARCSRWRCCPTPPPSTRAGPASNRAGVYTGVWTAGETLGLALGPGRLRAGARARRLPVLDRRRRRPARLRADRDRARLLAAAGGADRCSACCWLRALHASTPTEVAAATTRRRRRMTDALARLRGAAGRRPARARRPHPGLRLRLRLRRGRRGRPRGGGGVRRLQRARPDRVPEPAARWRTTSSASPAACSTRPDARGRHGDLRRHRVDACSPCRPPATRARTSTAPRMVLPATAHAAFHKAAHYFGVEAGAGAGRRRTSAPTPRRWPRPSTDDRTVLVVASAPSYAHGVVDPVTEIAAARRGARGPLPRRRLHRRLGAAVRRAARPRRCRRGRSPSRASRRSRSTCTSTPTPPRAPRCCCTATPALRAPQFFACARLAGLHDAQLDDAVDQVRRPARRRVGGGRVARRRRATSR